MSPRWSGWRKDRRRLPDKGRPGTGVAAKHQAMEFVHTDIADGIATVTFDRPPVNALSGQAFREIAEAFRSLSEGTEASVSIFTAPGDRVFCGGVDLQDSARRHARQLADGDTTVDMLDPGQVVRDCFWSLLDCPLPA